MVILSRYSVALLLLAACTTAGKPGQAPGGSSNSPADCVDGDSDGFGEACSAGADCDDHDPEVHEGCLRCATPAEGCDCVDGVAPTQCFLDPTESDEGEVMCHEGTRYCRNGQWSGCESVMTYTAPKEATSALIDEDAGLTRCNDCNVLCYRITDTLDPVDGGLNGTGSNIGWVNGGGLTLAELPQDGGVVDGGGPSSEVDSDYVCTPGVGNDLDCDGIPNNLDPYPISKPFATANPSIFLQIGPGETGTGQIDLDFFLNSADVYFLVDQSGSMAEERDQLKLDLTQGDFINDAAYECADYDFDHVPNNELKNQGIIGAIKCKIRDANFGTGFFREIPFSPYGPTDHVVFGNYQDITGNVDDVLDAIGRLTTVSNVDWPEASMVSLHNVLTGSGMYFGTTKKGIPARTNCTNQRWGYPCFRSEAVPIVVMFTDAPFHNGPSSNTNAYDSSDLDITAGTGDAYTWLPSTNETFNGAAVLGDVTTTYKTFAGDTRLMAADLTAAQLGSTSCISNSSGADAVYRFSLTQTKTVTIESTGSQFDTVLGLYTGVPGTPTNLAASTNTNELGTSALSLGTANMAHAKIAGNTTSMVANYQWSDVGCDSSGSSPDAVFKFTVTSPMQVALDTSGSAFDTVVSLHSVPPVLPPTYTALASNTNDTYLTPYAAGEVYNSIKAFSGNTSTLNSNYEQGQIGCGVDAAAAGKDAVYSFTLSTPTRVRVSTEGSSFDTVLALYDSLSNPIATGSTSGNDVQSTSYNTGILDGRILQISGSTAPLVADYYGGQLGCNANHTAPDAMFKFHLNTPRTVEIDTIGTTGWDPVVGLFSNSNIDPKTYTTTTNNNDVTPQALGTLHFKDLTVTGGTTTALTGDYTTPAVSCTNSATSPDAIYDFHLDNPSQVRINASSTAFDTVVALQRKPPADTSVTLATYPNDTVATTIDVGDIYQKTIARTASIVAAHTHNYDNVGCSASGSAKDVVYTFSLSQPTEVQIDTIGTTWDSVLGLYAHTMNDANPAVPAAVAVSGNESRTDFHNIGSMDNAWKRYTGNTNSMAADWSADSSRSGCDAAASARDAFYQFTLTAPAGATTRSVTIDTAGSSFDTVLFLYRYNSGSSGAYTWIDCDHKNSDDSSMTNDLAAGTYFVIVKGDKSSDRGAYALNLRDDATMSNKITCDDNGGGALTSSRIVASLGAGSYDVVVSSKSNAAHGTYKLRFRDKTWYDAFEVACDNDVTSATTSTSTIDSALLAAGDYRIMVKGYQTTDKGAYTLRVIDMTTPPVTPAAIGCDDNGGGGSNAKLVKASLAAGDYWVALKGRNAASSGTYKLNIKDTSASGSGTTLQCDDDGGDSPQSSIERDLQAGTYQVVVKGKTAAAAGAYKLSIRDMTHQPISRLTCANDGGGGTASYLEQAVTAGTYYAVVKGNAPTDKGAFSLTLRDVTNRPLTSLSCNDNGSTNNTSKITTSLASGTYYVALKGKTGTQNGPYQLSIGAGTTHAATYSPPTWYDTLSAIQGTKTRVIPILSCHDDSAHGDASGDCTEARTQSNALADASEALGSNLQRLVFDIDSDGAGLSDAVVDAVSELAAYLEMNVTVRVIFEPDTNPGFNVSVSAIDQPGDGCSGLIGITHQKCIPGAIPRFRIAIANPLAPNNVPLNPSDPNGGYNFRAELIGDGQFIVDYIPIYIIPKPAPPLPPPPPVYYPSGEYFQDVASPGCSGNQAPDWRDLDWTADVYGNTSITFKACAAQQQADLATCTPRTIAKIAGGGSCTSNADCTKGYCNTAISVCQVATAGACMVSSECPTNAFCDTTAQLCTFTSQPVYIGKALGELNFKSYMRMKMELNATMPFTKPPVLHRWEMTYICNQVL